MKLLRRDALCSYGRMSGSQSISVPAVFSQVLTGLGCVGAGIWVKCDTVQPALGQFGVSIHCPSNAASAVGFNFTNDTINVFGDSGVTTVTTAFTNQHLTKQWMHVYCETDLEQGRHRLYVNGVLSGDAAAVFNGTVIAAGSGGISYIGANRLGAASFVGWARELVVVPRRVTAAEVQDMYQKGAYPTGGYKWLCEDGVGFSVACTDTNDQPLPAFAGVATTPHMFSREVPFTLAPLDRNAGYCIRLDGANDQLSGTAASIYAQLQNARVLLSAIWVKFESFPATATGLYIPEASGATGYSLTVTPTGQVATAARTRSGGTAAGITSPLVVPPISLRKWHHLCAVTDLQGKTAKVYVDGILSGFAVAQAWEDNTYNPGVSAGSWSFGATTNFMAGFMDDLLVMKSAGNPPTDAEIRHYFLTGQEPVNMVPVLRLNFNEGIVGAAPQDSSGNGLVSAFSGIGSPFGPFPNSYMS